MQPAHVADKIRILHRCAAQHRRDELPNVGVEIALRIAAAKGDARSRTGMHHMRGGPGVRGMGGGAGMRNRSLGRRVNGEGCGRHRGVSREREGGRDTCTADE